MTGAYLCGYAPVFIAASSAQMNCTGQVCRSIVTEKEIDIAINIIDECLKELTE